MLMQRLQQEEHAALGEQRCEWDPCNGLLSKRYYFRGAADEGEEEGANGSNGSIEEGFSLGRRRM